MSLRFLSAIALAGVLLIAQSSFAQSNPPTADVLAIKAIDFLRTQAQAEDGSYTSAAGPGVTALVATGILRHGRSPDDPVVAKSLKYLESFVQPDGGVYKEGSNYRNYESCLAMVCFIEANKDGRYDKHIKAAEKFIKSIQWDEDEEKKKEDLEFGGAGYGGKKRPDLSNTAFFIEALRSSGNAADSEAIQRALSFVSRTQNHESNHNSAPFAAKNPDGGFYYTPAAGGDSQAGKTENGGLRSYASMTYAGLKSMIFAGVKPDDPRVQAALGWLKKNYDLKSNPGMGDAGLYYYYHTFAKALDALGEETFVDAAGMKHEWRKELVAELASRQRANGSWVNENSKWLEGDAAMVTGYALLSLSYCKSPK